MNGDVKDGNLGENEAGERNGVLAEERSTKGPLQEGSHCVSKG